MMVGDKYMTNNCGALRVVEYINAKKVLVKFVATGFEVIAPAGNIRRGKVKDQLYPSVYGVGFLGAGRNKPQADGKITACYRAWASMLERCYCPKYQARYPTYIGCGVDSRWHNFQNFAEWFESKYKQGLHLDKDIIVSGNKVYGPEFCAFVSAKTNTFTIDRGRARGNFMIGVSWHKPNKVFQAECRNPFTGKNEYLGCFKTELAAHQAWREKKHQHALALADEQHDARVADALRTKYFKEQYK